MSEHSQIIAELGYKRGNPRRTDVVNGIRGDGKPLTARVSISDEKRQQRERARRIEDMALAKELGISLNELCEGKSMKQPADSNFDSYQFAASVAAATFAQCWLEHDAVILDTETTGLDWGSEIVEISIIEARTGLILMNTLVRPINPIPAEATAIHGITNEMVADSPLFFDIAISVAQILNGRTVIAYNSAFDKKMLCSSAAYSSGEPPYVGSDFQCAMLAYAQFKGDWNHGHGDFKWHSLVNAAKQQGIELAGTAHRALYDCQLTRELILKMAAE